MSKTELFLTHKYYTKILSPSQQKIPIKDRNFTRIKQRRYMLIWNVNIFLGIIIPQMYIEVNRLNQK